MCKATLATLPRTPPTDSPLHTTQSPRQACMLHTHTALPHRTHTHTHTLTCAHTRTRTHAHTCAHTSTRTHTHTEGHTYSRQNRTYPALCSPTTRHQNHRACSSTSPHISTTHTRGPTCVCVCLRVKSGHISHPRGCDYATIAHHHGDRQVSDHASPWRQTGHAQRGEVTAVEC